MAKGPFKNGGGFDMFPACPYCDHVHRINERQLAGESERTCENEFCQKIFYLNRTHPLTVEVNKDPIWRERRNEG